MKEYEYYNKRNILLIELEKETDETIVSTDKKVLTSSFLKKIELLYNSIESSDKKIAN
jgi:hypothetical protein